MDDRSPLVDAGLDEQDAIERWRAFIKDAPALAAAIRQRFAANWHHVLGTLRADGSPRLSGTEVSITERGVLLGMMSGSRKVDDVERDPRVELHSAPVEMDLAGGDARLSGRLVPMDDPPSDDPDATWYGLYLERATLVRVSREQLILLAWDPSRSLYELRR